MLKKALIIFLLLGGISTGAWAQRGFWGGCTGKNMKGRYTDQQIGGFLIHQASSLLKEASRTMAKARNPEERIKLSRLMARYSKKMEALSVTMGENKLTQRDIEEFVRYTEKVKKEIRSVLH